MNSRISIALTDCSRRQLSKEDQLKTLHIARLLVEQHGGNAPVQAAYRLYSLADLGEGHEYQLMLEAMKLVEQIRPDALIPHDS